MDATTILAIAGILGTLAGGFGGHYLQAKLKDRSERQGQLHQDRTVLFRHAMIHAQREETHLDWLQTSNRSRKANLPDATARKEHITADMGLFAPQVVADDWRYFLNASEHLGRWLANDNFDEARPMGDVPELVRVREAISTLQASMRRTLGTPND